MKKRFCILAGTFTLLCCACAKEDTVTTQTDVAIQSTEQEQADAVVQSTEQEEELTVSEVQQPVESEPESEAVINQSLTGIWYYEGYLDECYQWTDYESFVDCDYDQDGLTDRVYRIFDEQQTEEICDYRIEFGNGKKLEIHGVTETGFPLIQAGDLDADNEYEILFSQQFGTSTNPRAFGNMALFDCVNGEYEEVNLPLAENKEANGNYNRCLTVEYKILEERSFLVTVQENGFQEEVYIDSQDIWDQYEWIYDEMIYPAVIYDVTLESDENKSWLSCSVQVFDKWSVNEIEFDLIFDEGEYTIQNMVLTKIN